MTMIPISPTEAAHARPKVRACEGVAMPKAKARSGIAPSISHPFTVLIRRRLEGISEVITSRMWTISAKSVIVAAVMASQVGTRGERGGPTACASAATSEHELAERIIINTRDPARSAPGDNRIVRPASVPGGAADPTQHPRQHTHRQARDGARISLKGDRPPRLDAFMQVVRPSLALPSPRLEVLGDHVLIDAAPGHPRTVGKVVTTPVGGADERHARDDFVLALGECTQNSRGLRLIRRCSQDITRADARGISAQDKPELLGPARTLKDFKSRAGLEVCKGGHPRPGRRGTRAQDGIVKARMLGLVLDPVLGEQFAPARGTACEEESRIPVHTVASGFHGGSFIPRTRSRVLLSRAAAHVHDCTTRDYPPFMRAHLVQWDLAWHDKQKNHALVEDLIDPIDIQPGDLIVLPEMFDTGFSWDTKVTADKDHATLGFLSELAEDLRATIVGGRTIQDCHCTLARNVATVIGPGGELLAQYTKRNLFPIGEESRRISPGTSTGTFRLPGTEGSQEPGLMASLAICYDLRFPEVFREGLAQGAELFIVPACWLEGRHAHWRALLIARAIENQAYVLGVNRTGSDPNARYLGGSIAISPRGDVLGELDAHPGVLSIPLDPREVRTWRESFPAWRSVHKALAPGH